MYAITFEADIVSEYLRIPNFEQLKNKHVRVVIEAEESQSAQTALPIAFTRPLTVRDYSAIGGRDEWYDRG